MTVEVLSPHGFCAGVTGALKKALRLAEERRADGSPVYCLHEIVHNELVVAGLRAQGFVFVESVEDVPEGATLLFSAHGVSPAVRAAAATRNLKVVDATCPFVARVHEAARSFAERGLPVVVIGKADHVEVKGIVGEVESVGGRVAVLSSVADIENLEVALFREGRAPVRPRSRSAAERSETRIEAEGRHRRNEVKSAEGRVTLPCGLLGVVSQTTMNADEVGRIVEALRLRFPVETTAEVCQATKVRQDAVKAFRGDALLVLGSVASSNTRRLCEVAPCRTFRAGTFGEVKALDFSGVRMLGVTAGASTPEDFIAAAVSFLGEGVGRSPLRW